uniref:Uncharacterized protein n=1 Tax=Anguilla anguilla TaxID=7936 RepID=A0A0E9W5M0_ANGAN
MFSHHNQEVNCVTFYHQNQECQCIVSVSGEKLCLFKRKTGIEPSS